MITHLKIGIIFTAYNVAPYLEKCLAPWFNLKNQINLKFAINSGMFSDYKKLGFTNKNAQTLEIINKYEFDYSMFPNENSFLLDEDDSRNYCLNYLQNHEKCDLIWFVDGDEIYREDEILNAIKFIEKTSDIDVYSVMFKNFTFNNMLHADFERINIYRTDRGKGLDRIYFDSHVIYNDGANYKEKSTCCIPKELLFIDHYSWLTDDTRTLEKIEYQKIRYEGNNLDDKCAYIIKNHDLFFSKKFYDNRNESYPVLHEFSEINDTRFLIDYKYFEKKLYIYLSPKDKNRIDFLNLKLFDNTNNKLILDWSFDIFPIIRLWHTCNLNGVYKLEISQNRKILHMENLYINYKISE